MKKTERSLLTETDIMLNDVKRKNKIQELIPTVMKNILYNRKTEIKNKRKKSSLRRQEKNLSRKP